MAKKYILKGCGGSGVTYFESKYSRNLIPTTKFGKHSKNYGDNVTPIVYLYANPVDVLLSFDRRGFIYPAIEQLDGLVSERDALKIPLTNPEGIGDWSLEQYLDNGVDLLQLEANYEYFKNAPQKVFFIKYEYLMHEKKIRDLLRIKASVHWSHINPRKTNIDDYTDKVKKQIEKMYGGLMMNYHLKKPIEIINQ